MFLRQVFDPYLAQSAYLIGCQKSGEALILDPQRDIDRYKKLAKENDLQISAVAETHIHADFLSGARQFAENPAIRLYLSGEGGADWDYAWPSKRPNTVFLLHGEKFRVGEIEFQAIHSPGHTPEHLSFLITDRGSGARDPMAFATGDFLFVGDVGRPDLLESTAGVVGAMEPAARQLRKSLVALLAPFEDYLQILPAHGAGSACGKSLGAVPTTTLGYERRTNSSLRSALADENGFVREILSGQPEPPPYFATMKRLNRDGSPIADGVPHVRHLDVKSFIEAAGRGRVVDARDDREVFMHSHAPGALHAPLHSSLYTAAVGSYLTENDVILLILEKPEDAELAVRQLFRIGYDHIAGWLTADEAKAGGLLTWKTERMEFASFDAALARERGEIVDVRTRAEYDDAHLEAAISIPYTQMKSRGSELSKSHPLFVHCASGLRAAVASSFLEAAGFSVIYLDGDIRLNKS